MNRQQISILTIAIVVIFSSQSGMDISLQNDENKLFIDGSDFDADGVEDQDDLCPYTHPNDFFDIDEAGCVQPHIGSGTFERQLSVDNLPNSWNGIGSGFLDADDEEYYDVWTFFLPDGAEGAQISIWETHEDVNDFDLYVYRNWSDFPDTPIEISETFDNPTETISFRAEDVGEYNVVISAFTGNGTFDAGIDIIENNAPLTTIESSDQSVYIYETVHFDACGTSDLDDDFDDLNFTWLIDYPRMSNGTEQSREDVGCELELTSNNIVSPGIYNISVTVTDPWGAFKESIYPLEVLSLPADGTSIRDDFIGEWAYDLSNEQPFTIGSNLNHRFLDIPFTDQDLYWATGMQYHINIFQEGELVLNQTITEQGDVWEISIETLSINASYEVTFKPEIIIDYYRWTEVNESGEEWVHGELLLPVPSQSEMYEDEPFVNIGSHTIYYWNDHVILNVSTANGTTGFSVDEMIDLAEVDLYPLVQSILEKTPVSGALQFIELFGDFSMPLTMGVNLNVDGIFGMSWIEVANATGTINNSTSYNDVIILDEGNFFPSLNLHNPSIISYLNASENGTNVSIYPFFTSYANGEVSGFIDIKFRVSSILFGEILNVTWRVLEQNEPDYEETFVNIPYEVAFNWSSPIDADGDGIRDDYDDCPLENATTRDSDMDGCLDYQSSSSIISLIVNVLIWIFVIALIAATIGAVIILVIRKNRTNTVIRDNSQYSVEEKPVDSDSLSDWGVNLSQIDNTVQVQQDNNNIQNNVEEQPIQEPTVVNQWTDERGYTWRTMSNDKMQWWNGNDWQDHQ